MTLIDSQIDEKEIMRYLFAEMEPGERDGFEERLFLSDELFFEVADIENHLVDDYVRGNLAGEDLAHFERSLGRIPERRQKVENARILSDYIGEERPIVSVEYAPEKSSIWQRFTGLVGGRTPAFAYGMAAMLAILTLSTSVLIVQNQRKNSELAGLQASQKRQEELQKELDSLSQREGELQNMIDSEREASGDLNEELQQEKTRRERIEQELAHLKKAHDVSAPTQRDPIIATFFLSPTVVGRGGNGGQIKNIAVGPGTMRIAVQLGLPDPVKAGERFSVNLNNRSIAHNLTTRTAASGSKSIQLTILPADLGAGRNTLGVVDASGTEISTYSFDFQKKK